MTTVERLKKYIDYKGISLHAFETAIGASNGHISRQIKTSGNLGSIFIERILEKFPDLNPEWLLTGKGEMLKKDEMQKNHHPMHTTPCALCEEKERLIQAKDQIIAALQAQIKLQAEQIEFLKSQISAMMAENSSKPSKKQAG